MYRLILLFALTLIAAGGSETKAQPRQPRAAHPKAQKIHARRVIRRTAIVIRRAHELVKENKVYTGNLARSIAHQRLARKLYFRGNYLRAMHQSRRARYFAVLAIQANKGTEPSGSAFEKEDQDLMDKNPVSDAELDKELDQEMPGYSKKDEDFVNAALTEIDLGDID
ncbi:MAG: hypothetical protein Fur0041_23230 [Bacteroidia bacterium]